MENDTVTRQILQGTQKAGKEYTFQAAEKYDPSRPAQWWFQESNEGLIIFVVFYSQACRWARCLGCNLPSKMSVEHIPFDFLIKQIDYLFSLPEVIKQSSTISKLIVSNNGSVLDEATFSSTALMYLLARVNMHFRALKVLALESRPEYVDTVELKFLARALQEGERSTALELCIGFEAFDEHIRNDVFDKGLTLHAFEELALKISPYGYRLKCYFMLKPVPGMSNSEAVKDIQQAIDYLDTISSKYNLAINMHLNPTYAARGTLLGKAFLQGKYTPPSLLDLAQAASFAEGKKISLFLGLSDEGLAEQGGSFIREGDEELIEHLEKFNRTQNYTLLQKLHS
ncbi:Elp3/MiaA/NifB-like radical SAM core domain-containing protein [Candidatus Electrothrix aarhusensis]